MCDAQREMTLKEWCGKLCDSHLVNKELKELLENQNIVINPDSDKLAKIVIDDHGEAPMCPPVYPDQPAVRVLGTGIVAPSWKAQDRGFQLVQADSWFKRKVLQFFFGIGDTK